MIGFAELAGLQWHHGDRSDVVVGRDHPKKPGSFNEVQTNPGDPNAETGWKYFGMFNGGKATLGGLTPASTVWVRVRAAGKGGEMSPWSDAAKIIVV